MSVLCVKLCSSTSRDGSMPVPSPAQSLSFLEGSSSMFLEGFRLGPVLGSAFLELL